MLQPTTVLCPDCHNVCFLIRTRCRRDIMTETAPIYIYPSDAGEDIGYTEDGRLIRGDKVDPKDYPRIRLYECHELHDCLCRAEAAGRERRRHGIA